MKEAADQIERVNTALEALYILEGIDITTTTTTTTSTTKAPSTGKVTVTTPGGSNTTKPATTKPATTKITGGGLIGPGARTQGYG
jgi:hypothetical protein